MVFDYFMRATGYAMLSKEQESSIEMGLPCGWQGLEVCKMETSSSQNNKWLHYDLCRCLWTKSQISKLSISTVLSCTVHVEDTLAYCFECCFRRSGSRSCLTISIPIMCFQCDSFSSFLPNPVPNLLLPLQHGYMCNGDWHCMGYTRKT